MEVEHPVPVHVPAPTQRSRRLVRDFSDDVYLDEEPEHLTTSPARSPVPRSSDAQHVQARESESRSPSSGGRGVLSPIEEKSYYEPSMNGNTPSVHTTHTGITDASSNRMMDFFGTEIFQIVLHNPTTAHQLTKFAQTRFCGENMEFLEQVDKYNTLLNEMTKTMFDIHRKFISVNAPAQLNLSDSLMIKINKDLKSTLTQTFPKMESIFSAAQADVENIVASDIYPRFVRHQMTMSASRALATDRGKYAGLGDCFVLTNPAKADNPIVHASDGFVKVTGYTRADIIPRNCRFLQGVHTDRQSVKRIKMAVDNRHESVELLLNYKKNGEPFWNLLYTTPLYNAEGLVIFFLGAQINCSTTVHSHSDIMRILATAQDVEEDKKEASDNSVNPNGNSSSISNFFRSLRGHPGSRLNAPPRPAGMENTLLDKIEKMDLSKQMDSFYTAYSKYFVISYDTNFICFYSNGIVDMLYPRKENNGQVVGVDVFKYLGYHAMNLSKDFKARVRNALRVGAPVSLDLNLCTRKFMGFEKFITHWTPLKNEAGAVSFIVLTLGAVQT